MNKPSHPTMALVTLAVSALLATGVKAEHGSESTDAKKVVNPNDLARLPVREITVFKDGHAFVLHEGDMPTDEHGDVVLDYLPAPVIGTFWPYSSDPAAKLTAVVAGTAKVHRERTALSLRELLEANPGIEALITENSGLAYAATLLGVPVRKALSPTGTGAPPTTEASDQVGDVVLVRTSGGIKVVPIDRIRDLTFLGEPKLARVQEEWRDLLTLKLDWAEPAPHKTVSVGLAYLQKGVRWIPSYKVSIDGNGTAQVELQATLLNELTDLTDVTAHLVIGVPSFAFEDTIDPISLQRTAARLSEYFQTGGQTAFAFSNAIMTQHARAGEYRAHARPTGPRQPGAEGGSGPDLPGAGRNEDLFIFTVENVTLRKGERMVLPVVSFSIPYKDVFTLDIPFTPPPEVRGSFNNRQQVELARLFNAPKVMHTLRLSNDSRYPLTTAPTIILQGGRLLAQGMMTYTVPGGTSDLEVTAAVDIQVAKSEVESGRTKNAEQWQNRSYDLIDLKGTISLTNYRGTAIDVEVTRHVLGHADTADHDGTIERVNLYEEGSYLARGGQPHWWGWYSWPNWWRHFNGIGRIEWRLTLEPDEQIDLQYTWHYYWRW